MITLNETTDPLDDDFDDPDEPTPGTLAIIEQIEIQYEYLHCCGGW